jgi:hypothetical protein
MYIFICTYMQIYANMYITHLKGFGKVPELRLNICQLSPIMRLVVITKMSKCWGKSKQTVSKLRKLTYGRNRGAGGEMQERDANNFILGSSQKTETCLLSKESSWICDCWSPPSSHCPHHLGEMC